MNNEYHKFTNLNLQTLIPTKKKKKKKSLFKWVKINIIIYLCVKSNFYKRSQILIPQI